MPADEVITRPATPDDAGEVARLLHGFTAIEPDIGERAVYYHRELAR